MTPSIGIAKLNGSSAKNPKASVAGSSQVGRFGWRNAAHKSRISLAVSRHSRKILRMPSSIGVYSLFRPRSADVVHTCSSLENLHRQADAEAEVEVWAEIHAGLVNSRAEFRLLGKKGA
jgi:hypothetical protein